jgi:hypothetical protein
MTNSKNTGKLQILIIVPLPSVKIYPHKIGCTKKPITFNFKKAWSSIPRYPYSELNYFLISKNIWWRF